MIVKKIKASVDKAKGASIRDLANYIERPEEHGQEKCSYRNGINFDLAGNDPTLQREEMVALASEAARSKNPVNHYILSWQEGEQPTPEQADAAVKTFLNELGLEKHQAIYALHDDTDNVHLHLMVNRVHPETMKCVEINRGYDIEAAHKAIARIEQEQGWNREQGARYQVLENGELGREHKQESTEPSTRARDYEHRTGAKSAERVAKEDGAEVVKNAKTWEELHRGLAGHGMSFEKKGSGAIVRVGNEVVKASDMGKQASMGALQKRLGPFEPAPADLAIKPRADMEPMPQAPRSWDQYAQERRQHYGRKDSSKAEMDAGMKREWDQLRDQQKTERKELFAGDWRGKGVPYNALKSLTAAKHAQERITLREDQRQQREAWKAQHGRFPDYNEWCHQRGLEQDADKWKLRHESVATIKGKELVKAEPQDIRDYQGEIAGNAVHYWGGGAGGVSFVDIGKEIQIHDTSKASTLAALQLAASKWGEFQVTGDQKFKDQVVQLAAEHGLKVTNPELQDQIRAAREQIQEARREAMKSEELKQFEKYAEAVGAERYRVTSIKMLANDKKMTFILDKQNGVTKGFTPQEMAGKISEMQRLQRKGENLYYTPLSENKHHVLIDDMNADSLKRLEQDGYKPAVVLESSPGNYQALLTIPKLGTEHDKDVGNRLTEQLNKEYGDQNLSGCIHPHRAPGFENRKPKHEREDGTFPAVKLVRAETVECQKALERSVKLDAEHEQRAQEKPQRAVAVAQDQQPVKVSGTTLSAQTERAVAGYRIHAKDVLARQGEGADLSRVDAMVAVRLRMTGHRPEAIERALAKAAPELRTEPEGRNWEDYAARTTRYAFGPAGDRDGVKLAKYQPQWCRMEGRDQNLYKQFASEIVTEPDFKAMRGQRPDDIEVARLGKTATGKDVYGVAERGELRGLVVMDGTKEVWRMDARSPELSAQLDGVGKQLQRELQAQQSHGMSL